MVFWNGKKQIYKQMDILMESLYETFHLQFLYNSNYSLWQYILIFFSNMSFSLQKLLTLLDIWYIRKNKNILEIGLVLVWLIILLSWLQKWIQGLLVNNIFTTICRLLVEELNFHFINYILLYINIQALYLIQFFIMQKVCCILPKMARHIVII